MANSPTLGVVDQSDLGPEEHNAYLRVHAVNIYVRDQEQSLRFYLDQLGFSLAFDVRLQSGRALGGSLSSGRHGGAEFDRARTRLGRVQADRSAHVGGFRDGGCSGQVRREWRKRGVRFRHTPGCRRVKFEQSGATMASRRPPHRPGERAARSGAACSRASKTSIAILLRWSASTR